jgi:ubiquinone/menaquinone biosynthesis C-methylase UbiE
MEPREYETLYKVEEFHWWYRALHKALIKSLNDVFGDSRISVLDAGCGTGYFLKKIEESYDTFGIDFSKLAIKFASLRNLSRIACASVENIPFKDASFDAVTSADVLYHKNVSDDQKALREFHRILKPDGMIIMNLPAFEFLRSSHDQAIHTHRRYTKKQLRMLIEQCGFKIEKLYYRNSILFLPAALIRILRKRKNTRSSDVVLPGKITNQLLTQILFLDDSIARVIPFPAGLSLFCVARKSNR